MARNRMVKPEFWTDEKTGMLSSNEKCLFLGMLNYADDEGLIIANEDYLKAMIFPYDYGVKSDDIKNMIDNLTNNKNLLFLYSVNYQNYAWIINFRKHQRIDKPQKPKYPAPSNQNNIYKLSIHRRDNFICHICGEFTIFGDDHHKNNFSPFEWYVIMIFREIKS